MLTGIGAAAVKVPRLRDRGPGEDKISFTPILGKTSKMGHHAMFRQQTPHLIHELRPI
nr:hypothetical protein [Sinirhodobacter populi]